VKQSTAAYIGAIWGFAVAAGMIVQGIYPPAVALILLAAGLVVWGRRQE
jgi:hypothetical protein